MYGNTGRREIEHWAERDHRPAQERDLNPYGDRNRTESKLKSFLRNSRPAHLESYEARLSDENFRDENIFFFSPEAENVNYFPERK